MTTPAIRQTARVVLLDRDDRVLLVRLVDRVRGATWWCTPGGGVDPGETHEQAACREIAEETGLENLALGPCVWTREHSGEFMGRPFRLSERIFVARVDAFEPDASRYSDLEKLVQTETRWWRLDELEASDEAFAPTRLPALLRALLTYGPPPEPIDVGV